MSPMSQKYQKIYNMHYDDDGVCVCVCVWGGGVGRHTALTPAAVKIKLVVNDDSLEGTHQRKESSRLGFIESVYVQ